jgi:hypothetical protein
MNWPKQSFAFVVSGSLILATAQAGCAAELEQPMGQSTAAAVLQSPEALDQIVTQPDVLFGLGIGIGAFAAFGWGYHHWGTDCRGHSVVYNHNNYVARSHAFASHNAFYGAPTTFYRSGGFNVGAWHRPAGMRYGAFNGFNRGGVTPDLRFPRSPSLGGGFHVGMRETPYRVSSSTPTDGPHRPPLRSTSRQANSWATLRAPPASANSWHRVAIR